MIPWERKPLTLMYGKGGREMVAGVPSAKVVS